MDSGQALAVLDRYFNEIKGKNNMVSHDDLKKIAESKPIQGLHDAEISYAEDLRAAAGYLLRQRSDYDALDTAQERKGNKGSATQADSFFSKGDLAAALSNEPLAQADMEVLKTLLGHVDDIGNRITQCDLKNIADDVKRPKELKDAATYMLEHTDFWTRIDTALRMSKCDVSEQGGDGIASAADIRALADRPEFKKFKSDSI